MKGNVKSTITPEEIGCILEDYRIGKKPLAKLLGWGETTIIRYMDGDIPTGEYAEKLRKILDSPQYYYELLLGNKKNLTDVAFKKSKKAVLSKVRESKLQIVSQYLINLYKGEISTTQLQVLLFYVQGLYLAFFEKPLFKDEFRVNGNNRPYIAIQKEMLYCMDLEIDLLQETEMEYLKRIQSYFSWYGPRAFFAIFEQAKGKLKISRDKNNNKVVTANAIRNFFIKDLEEREIRRFIDIPLYLKLLIEEAQKI